MFQALKINIFGVLLCFFLFNPLIFSQTEFIEPCGVSAEDQYDNAWLNDYRQNPDKYSHFQRSNDIIYLPLTVHLIGRSDGTGYFSDDNLDRELCELNEQFRATNIQFFVQGNVLYHANTNWFNHATRQVGNAMYQATRVPGTINCYIDNFASGACGYATIGGDRVFLRISCVGQNSTTWAHELGHSLTLPHTFVGWEGTTYEANTKAPNFVGNRAVERVDGSNCATAADGFCDTDPDYISNRWSCNANGESTIQLIDPDSIPFRAKAKFFMGYSSDACMSVFSDEQIAAMRAHSLSAKANMVTFDNPFTNALSSPSTDLVLPELNEVVTGDSILLAWRRVGNAQGYRVQLSRFQSMGILIEDIIVQDTFLYLSNLEVNRNYFWRVRPESNQDFCKSFSTVGRFRFEEELQTSTREIEGVKFEIFPTILMSGQHLTINAKSIRSLDVDLRVIDFTGKVVHNQAINLQPGILRESIVLPVLPSGMYFINFASAGQMFSSKFVVQ